MEIPVRMRAAVCAGRHAVEVVDAPDVEWDMTGALDEGQASARIIESRELDQSAVVQHSTRTGRSGGSLRRAASKAQHAALDDASADLQISALHAVTQIAQK